MISNEQMRYWVQRVFEMSIKYAAGNGVHHQNMANAIDACLLEREDAKASVSDTATITREEATDIAVAWAKAERPSYYSEPFTPHDWVIEAIMYAANRSFAATRGLAAGGVPDAKTDVSYESDEDGHIDVYSQGHMDGWNDCREAILATAKPAPEITPVASSIGDTKPVASTETPNTGDKPAPESARGEAYLPPGLFARFRNAVRALFSEQKIYAEDIDTMLEVRDVIAKLEYIAGPKAWCQQCGASRLYSGDPNCIHLHLCHTCKGVVDEAHETAPNKSPSASARVPEGWRSALRDLLAYVDANTCTHEETHRGGSIWTICDQCGEKWADDRGGFVPHTDNLAVSHARSLPAAAPKPEADGGDA